VDLDVRAPCHGRREPSALAADVALDSDALSEPSVTLLT